LGSRIPYEIKIKVRDQWFLGLPRDVIASCNGIGCGSVTRIINYWGSTEVPDIDLLRGVAVQIRNEGLTLNKVAYGIRIHNYLLQMGSSEAEMDRLLREIDVHSFKTNQTFHDFVMQIHEVHGFARRLGISIHQVPEYIADKKKEIQTLENRLRELNHLILQKEIESRRFR